MNIALSAAGAGGADSLIHPLDVYARAILAVVGPAVNVERQP